MGICGIILTVGLASIEICWIATSIADEIRLHKEGGQYGRKDSTVFCWLIHGLLIFVILVVLAANGY